VTRALKGLEDAISVSVVDPYRDEDGWQFTPEKAGCTPDYVHGADFLRELYVRADPDATCRVTVPVLWDKQEDAIVNNESEEIMRMLDTEFDEIASRDVDLYPEGYRDEADRIIDEIYEPINNGVYIARASRRNRSPTTRRSTTSFRRSITGTRCWRISAISPAIGFYSGRYRDVHDARPIRQRLPHALHV